MLCKEILAVEIVVNNVVTVCYQTHVASPEAEFNVLSADMTLPFILGRERRLAAVSCKWAGKGTQRRRNDCFPGFWLADTAFS